jgi:hypothetical protein
MGETLLPVQAIGLRKLLSQVAKVDAIALLKGAVPSA